MCWTIHGEHLPAKTTKPADDHTYTVLELNPHDEKKPHTLSALDVYCTYLDISFSLTAPSPTEWAWVCKLLREDYTWVVGKQGLPPLLAQHMQADQMNITLLERSSYLNCDELTHIQTKGWQLNDLDGMASLPVDVRECFMTTCKSHDVNATLAGDILSHVLMITKSYGSKIALDLLQKQYAAGVNGLKQALLSTAQPDLARKSNERVEHLRALKLPPRTALTADPYFEKPGLKLNHTTLVSGDWEAFKDWVNRPETTAGILALVDEKKN